MQIIIICVPVEIITFAIVVSTVGTVMAVGRFDTVFSIFRIAYARMYDDY